MIIESATREDLCSMARLTRNALSFVAPPTVQRWESLTDAELEEDLSVYIHGANAGGYALVARANEETVGFVACEWLQPRRDRRERKEARVDMLAVAPAYRGRGIGTHLVQELTAALRNQGIREIDVNVASENEAAVRFWKRLGFLQSAVTLSVRLTE